MKRLVVLILTGCLLLSLASCSLLQKKQTLYVVTGQKQYVDGQLQSSATFEYDDHGRPLAVEMQRTNAGYMKSELTYDQYGNVIRETVEQYHPDYLSFQYQDTADCRLSYTKGLLTRAELMQDGERISELILHYDDQDRLILVEYDPQKEDKIGGTWQNFSYDRDGNLIRETWCRMIKLRGRWQCRYDQIRYSYDDQGRLTELCRLSSQETTEQILLPEETETLEFIVSDKYHYFFYYDSEGRLAYVGDGAEDTYPGGSADVYSDKNYTFDENGNLVRVQYDEGRWVEYTYEAIQVSREDAVMAKRLMHGAHGETTIIEESYTIMDPLFWEVCPATLYHYRLWDMPFYYLIPYPQYELFLDK